MTYPPHDPHYLRHVADLAARREMVALTPIISAAGAKILDRGQRFESSHYGELIKHQLIGAVEESLAVTDPVSPAALAQAVEDMQAFEPAFAALAATEGERRYLAHLFATLPLAPPLAFKLTVARDQRPELFRHSIQVAWCAAALALHCHLPPHEQLNAVAAGVFHDLGLLHVDPAQLKSRRALLEEERRYLYAHPLTAYLMLQRSPIWHPEVSTAVLEHHERLDGSGYPRGQDARSLGQLGQLLAVAELAATLLAWSGSQASRHRLGVVLRLNEGKLNHEYSSRLLNAFAGASCGDGPPHSAGEALELLLGLSINFLRWQAVAQQAPACALTAFIAHRMERLDRSLAAVGIDLEYWYAFSADADLDAKSVGELAVAAREGVWQLHAIAHEVHRRWQHLQPGADAIAAAVRDWLDGIDGAWASQASAP